MALTTRDRLKMIEAADKDEFLKMFQEQRKEDFKVCVTRVWFFERSLNLTNWLN